MIDYQSIIDKYYESGSPLREILIRHSRQVADKALAIAERKHLALDREQVEAAAMLHDIGIAFTDAPGIECHGTEPYIAHGMIGAELLRREGAPEWAARVAERHTGSGLTAAELRRALRDQADRYAIVDLMPETLLEQLICYADKFYSKSGDMQEKSLERVRASMQKHGDEALKRFDDMTLLFG